jgi:hypothetical protein
MLRAMKSLALLCVVLARAILGDTRARRQWMFFLTLGVLAFVFGGYFLLFEAFQRHPWLFGVYVLGSFAGLFLLMIFATFDFLMLRKTYLAARKEAIEEVTRDMIPPPENVAQENRARE